MWFLLFGIGAAFLHRARLPAVTWRYVLVPPPPEAKYAIYFLVAALLRLAIRDARVAQLERRAKRDVARAASRSRQPAAVGPGLMDVGVGVGKGVAEVVLGGDLLGVAVGGMALLLRLAMSRRADPAVLVRRAAERKKAAVRERRRAALCIVGVGLVCVLAAWVPLVAPRAAWLAAAVRARLPWN